MSFSCFCQTARIDSIKNILNGTRQDDRQRLATLFVMCGQYNSLHPDSLLAYVQASKRLSVKSPDYTDIALSGFYEALYNSKKGRTDTALAMVEKWLSDKKVQALPLVQNKFKISRIALLVRQNKLKEALENALLNLHDAEQNNYVEDQVKAQIQIGWIYMELNQNADALKWLFIALATNEKNRDEPEPAVLNSNIAAIYNALRKNDSAVFFITKAIRQARQEQDLSFLCNASYIYSDICIDNGNPKKAEELLKDGIEIRRKIGDPFYIVSDLAQLGKFYANTNQYGKGIETIKEGIAIATSNHITAKLVFLYSILAENYKAAHDLLNYSNTLFTLNGLKDSLYSHNSAEAMSELQTKYEVQKKENTIIQQRFVLVKRTYWIYGAAALLVFGCICWYLTYKNSRRKQEQKLALVLLEEKRLSEIAVLAAEEKERKRIAADLHDTLGAYAAAIAANADYLGTAPNQEKQQGALDQLKSNSQSIVSQLNDTIWVLTKEVLALTAISDRLKVFIQRLQNSYPDVQVDVKENISNDHLLAPMQALNLFKILQEAISNALKHSRGNKISVTIESDEHWRVTIADNGTGMPASFKPTTGGNGLGNIKKRSRDSGWQVDFQSNEQNGTIVIISSVKIDGAQGLSVGAE
ncbi:MAG: ATP-binding protein [Ferruginibacter sp.]